MPMAKRLLVYYAPNGIAHDAWRPTGVGTGYMPSSSLQPLFDQGVEDDVTVITGINNEPANLQDGGAHFRGTASLLTCESIRKGVEDIYNGVSADQLIARAAPETPYRSLQLGTRGGSLAGPCGGTGFGCIYISNISWSGPTTPLAKIANPAVAFDRLFRGQAASDPESAARRRLYGASVLDFVREDAARLSSRVSTRDQARLDEYLTGLRDVERRIDASTRACEAGDPPSGGTGLVDRIDQMIDLMVMAFRCDLTRVMTFMSLNAGAGDPTYTWVNGPDGMPLRQAKHDISHHQDRPEQLARLAAINAWEVSMFASLVQRLKAVEVAPETSLLDESTVIFSNECGDPNAHLSEDMPVLIAGTGGGAWTPGRHIAAPDRTPWANVLLTIMREMGVEAERFGDSTGEFGALRS